MSRNRLTALLVDDEPPARQKLRTLLEEHADIEVLGECVDGYEALACIARDRPDLLFLDIQMPGLDGFQVLEALDPTHLPHVIFVTAYDRYAIRAFEVHALDYLLKPFDGERFRRTLDRARGQRSRSDGSLEGGVRELLEQLRQKKQYASEIPIKHRGRTELIRTSDIDWIGAAGNYLEVHASGKRYLVRDTMKDMEERLDPEKFVRIHRSRFVNRDRVRQVENGAFGDYRLTLVSGIVLQSGRNFGSRIRAWLGHQRGARR